MIINYFIILNQSEYYPAYYFIVNYLLNEIRQAEFIHFIIESFSQEWEDFIQILNGHLLKR